MQTPNILLNRKFNDFDQLQQAIQFWNIDFRQLDRGESPATILQLNTPRVIFSHLKLTRHYDQLGGTPKHMKTFGLLEKTANVLSWCGNKITPDNLLLFKPAAEFNAVSKSGFNVYTISLDEKLFADICSDYGYMTCPDKLTQQHQAYVCQPLQIKKLRETLRYICHHLNHTSPHIHHSIFNTLEYELPQLLIATLLKALPLVNTIPKTPKRQLALKRSLELLQKHHHPSILVKDLCKAVGVSERTLEYTFQEHFGVSPKTYLNRLRFNKVRGELLINHPGSATVSTIAQRWGFWHMSQFSVDYAKTFHELPSETLKRPNSNI